MLLFCSFCFCFLYVFFWGTLFRSYGNCSRNCGEAGVGVSTIPYKDDDDNDAALVPAPDIVLN